MILDTFQTRFFLAVKAPVVKLKYLPLKRTIKKVKLEPL